MKQPIREKCKVCGEKINNLLFESHKIKYYLCNNCGNLNGEFLDTRDFAKPIYIEDDYGSVYMRAKSNNTIIERKNIYA